MSAPNKNSVPRVVRTDGIEKIGLKPEEAFVFTRVDGNASFDSIAKILGYDFEKVWNLLSRLVDLGFIEVEGKKPADSKKVGRPERGQSILDQLDQEDQDPNLKKLSREWRKDIQMRAQGLEKKSHYEVLDLDPLSKPSFIQKQYFRLIKDLHPDRFFGQEIGHYREKLETLFGRVSLAFEHLNDPIKRKSYDRTLHAARKKERSPEKKEEKGEKKEEKPSRRMGNTLIEKIAQGKHYFRLGQEEEANGNALAAANFYAMAHQYDPKNTDYDRARSRTKPLIERKKADDVYSRAIDCLNRGSTGEATAFLEEALKMNPRKKECFRDLARIYSRSKLSMKRARELGEKAMNLFPDDSDSHATMGHIYKALGLASEAKKAFKVALKLDKENEFAQIGLADLGRK